MIRIVLFLGLIALAAAGAAWVAEQPGDVVLSWGVYKLSTTLPVFVLGVGIVVVAAMLVWSIFAALWRTPGRMRRRRHERRHARHLRRATTPPQRATLRAWTGSR